MTSFRYIGTKRRAKEHPRFVSGRGRFVADIVLPGMKHVALVASPHAAARIVRSTPRRRSQRPECSASSASARESADDGRHHSPA